MKYKFLPASLFLATSVVCSAASSAVVLPVGAQVQEFFQGPAVHDFKSIVGGAISNVTGHITDYNKKISAKAVPSLGSTFTTKEQGEAQGSLENFLKDSPSARKAPVLNAGFADLEGFDSLPSVSNEGALQGKIEQAKNYAKSVTTPKPASAVEQGKVLSPKPVAAPEQEIVKEKSLFTQISENPGTTAALTAGTVIVLYGSYKLIQYFDQKKAKKIALAKRLKAQGMQSSVVFE